MQIDADQMLTYMDWLVQTGFLQGSLLAVMLAFLGFVVSYLVALARYGPTEGFYVVAEVISKFFREDLPGTSLRRILAIARLAVQEAVRRRVLAVFAVFVVGLLFAGWYLDPSADDPAKLYISFVMTSINYMMILLGLFLASFSLPADIKNRTIYTIVTKPVRPTEIILGRIFGFAAVGSVLLLAMGFLSFVFVVRGIRHDHEISTIDAEGRKGKSTYDARHTHNVTMTSDGEGVTDQVKGHSHTVTVKETADGKKIYSFGPPEGALQARIPVYGLLRFTKRDGKDGDGISVGYENTYRKYIEGASLASAIWTFDNITASRFGEKLNLEMTITAYRTYKGDIETGVRGNVILRSPDGKVESDRFPFIIQEYQVDKMEFPSKLKGFRDGQPTEIDLYKDIVQDGKLEVIIRCNDQGQYFGMAPGDLYLKAGNAPFAWNFFKGFLGIWFQMVIVIAFGVMFSTFLTGPVAMISTMAALVLGFFGSLAVDALQGDLAGGGPIESSIRMVTQASQTVPLDLGSPLIEEAIRRVDQTLLLGMTAMASALPNFQSLNTSDFVAYGINIFGGLVARHGTITIGYLLLTTIIGYFFLKTREFAA
jgi:ABC-type transport system involved in multi-copper enzyme maturation permease subunit